MRSFDGTGATVLLLGNYRPTIALVRALGQAGHRTIVGLGGGEGGAEYSRFASEAWDHPPLEGSGDAFLAALRAFLARRPDVGVVFPVAEEFVRAVSKGRDALPADRLYVLPSAQAVAATLDKVAAYRLAESAGVPVAPWAVVERPEDLAVACARLGFPVVLRPTDSRWRFSGDKAITVLDPEDLARWAPEWPAGDVSVLAQRQVTGPRHNVYFAAHEGRIVRIMEAVIERTDRRDGTGLAVAGHTVLVSGALERHTAALAAQLHYTGVGCAQYLVASDGAWFLELNPRIGGNHAIAEAAGLELGVLAVVLAAADPPDVPFVSGRPGIVYAWTYGDLGGMYATLRKGKLGFRGALRWTSKMVAAFFAANMHMTWRWNDPLPTLFLYARHLPGFRFLLTPRRLPHRARPKPARARLDEAPS